jgi:hypothetical protein
VFWYKVFSRILGSRVLKVLVTYNEQPTTHNVFWYRVFSRYLGFSFLQWACFCTSRFTENGSRFTCFELSMDDGRVFSLCSNLVFLKGRCINGF